MSKSVKKYWQINVRSKLEMRIETPDLLDINCISHLLAVIFFKQFEDINNLHNMQTVSYQIPVFVLQ